MEEPIKEMCNKCRCMRCPQEFLKNVKVLKSCLHCRTYSNNYRLKIKNNKVPPIPPVLPQLQLQDLDPIGSTEKPQHTKKYIKENKLAIQRAFDQIHCMPPDKYNKGIGAQQKAFDLGDKLEHKCFIAYQQKLGSKWSNTYTSFTDIQAFLDYQETIETQNRRFYEIIRTACPEYYDLDFKLDNWNGDTPTHKINIVIDEFIRVRNEFSYNNTFNNMTYKKEDLIVLEACGNTKLSLHIIMRPEINRRSKRYFATCKQHKIFSQLFEEFLKTQNTKITIDLSVYNTNSLMRLKDSHKGDEVDRKFNAYTKNITDLKLFFCSYVGEEKGDFPLEVKEEVKVENKIQEYSFLEAYLTKNEHKILFDNLHVSRWDDYDTCIKMIWLGKKLDLTDSDIHYYCLKSLKYNFQWVQDTIDRRREYCPFNVNTLFYYLKRDLTPEAYNLIVPSNLSNTYKEIKETNNSRRTKEQQLYLDTVNHKILTRQIDSLFTYNENTFIKFQTIPEEIPFVQDIIFPEGFRCIGIHACLGRGKTQSLIRLVKSMPIESKVLILSPRITYSTNICAEYNSELTADNQFHCYITYRKNGKSITKLSSQNKIVCSMESLHYLKDYTPDLLIIDECNANLIAHCSTETNGIHLDNNIYEFKRLLDNSTRIVVADAFLGSKLCNFFFDLKISLYIYKYRCKPKELKAMFMENFNKDVLKDMKAAFTTREYNLRKAQGATYVSKIEKLLNEKKNVYAFMSSRKSLELLETFFQDKFKCEFYSGVSQNEIPDNLNQVWDTKNLVATTSTITVGISHTTPNHFDTKVIYFQSASKNYISDAIQAHFRVRHINELEIFIEIEESLICSNWPVNMKNFEEKLNHTIIKLNEIYTGYDRLPIYMRNLVSHNYLEHTLSIQAPTIMMKKYLVDCNYKIYLDDTINGTRIEDTSLSNLPAIAYKHEIIRELVENFPNAPRIVELEKEKLKRKLTASERLEIDRFWFFNMYTGGNPTGYRDTNISTVALAYQIWKYQFRGKNIIKDMRLEKKVIEGKITIKELAEKKWAKTQFAELQTKEIIKIQRIISVCKKLGLKHCNDTETEISQEKMNDFYTEAQHEYDNIRMDMEIQDKRVNKGKPTETQFTGLCKSVFTATDHSMCKLEVIKERKVRQKDGTRTRVKSYGLVPNKSISDEVSNFNLENKDNQIDDKNIPNTLYNNLKTTGKESLDEYKSG